MKLPAVLTIAGSDSSGGAGIQADIKAMLANGAYAMSAITALTAQNTLGVRSVLEVPPEFLAEQINCVFEDIPPQAVKIGMVASIPLIETIAERLTHYKAQNIVLDPVMIATSGARLMAGNAADALITRLLPLAAVVTPNLFEAEILADMKIKAPEDMLRAAEKIVASGTSTLAVMLKGGHNEDNADDLLYHNGKASWLKSARIDNPNTHGTGCTLSSAIAANLAKGEPLLTAARNAKNYITGALNANLNLGHGSGPLHHGFAFP